MARRDGARSASKGFGCVGVLEDDGRLAGIITDGDLRRHMRPDLMAPARRGRDDARADDGAADSCWWPRRWRSSRRRKIGALIVVEDERPVGLVHILDLLRIGAV